MTQFTQARELLSTSDKYYESGPTLDAKVTSDLLRRDDCWKLDKITGELIPCDPPITSGGRAADGDSGSSSVSSDPMPAPTGPCLGGG